MKEEGASRVERINRAENSQEKGGFKYQRNGTGKEDDSGSQTCGVGFTSKK